MDIELVYARPESVWRCTLQMRPCSTAQDALEQSRFFELFPDYPAVSAKVGIFGQQCSLDRPLKTGDRIEVYRPLIFDPMESRRRRARHRQQARV